MIDPVLTAADSALRTLFARPHATRALPAPSQTPGELTDAERREAGALMRVNHVGEVCAHALYTAQAAVASDPALEPISSRQLTKKPIIWRGLASGWTSWGRALPSSTRSGMPAHSASASSRADWETL